MQLCKKGNYEGCAYDSKGHYNIIHVESYFLRLDSFRYNWEYNSEGCGSFKRTDCGIYVRILCKDGVIRYALPGECENSHSI